jgi:phosphoserine phosphatase RsbX
VEAVKIPMIDYGVSRFILPGESESGDQYLVCCTRNGVLLAVADGIGHGKGAAAAAKVAIAELKNCQSEPVITMFERCHEKLRSTRGVVLSLALVEPEHGMMTWLGVGNVEGMLVRAGSQVGASKEMLLLRAGVLGDQLPALQAAVLPVFKGATIVFATDGVKNEFAEDLSCMEPPQRAADRILERYHRGNDDALVLVAKLTGVSR